MGARGFDAGVLRAMRPEAQDRTTGLVTRRIFSPYRHHPRGSPRFFPLSLADGLGLQELAKHVEFWKEIGPKGFGEKAPFPASQFHHFKGLGTIEGHGFFHQHVLACVKCQHDPAVMQIVRGGHVDHIEIVRGDEFLVVAIGSLERHARGEFLGSVFGARADGYNILPGVGAHRLNEAFGDPT
jgi:hypothetical protein